MHIVCFKVVTILKKSILRMGSLHLGVWCQGTWLAKVYLIPQLPQTIQRFENIPFKHSVTLSVLWNGASSCLISNHMLHVRLETGNGSNVSISIIDRLEKERFNHSLSPKTAPDSNFLRIQGRFVNHLRIVINSTVMFVYRTISQ